VYVRSIKDAPSAGSAKGGDAGRGSVIGRGVTQAVDAIARLAVGVKENGATAVTLAAGIVFVLIAISLRAADQIDLLTFALFFFVAVALLVFGAYRAWDARRLEHEIARRDIDVSTRAAESTRQALIEEGRQLDEELRQGL